MKVDPIKDLRPFLGLDKDRWTFEPVSLVIDGANWVAATNGHFLAAMPSDEKVVNKTITESALAGIVKMIRQARATTVPLAGVDGLKLGLEVGKTCKACRNTGNRKCDDCGGKGRKDCECDGCGHQHVADCGCFDGLVRCPSCRKQVAVAFHGTVFDESLLRYALRFLGAKVCWAWGAGDLGLKSALLTDGERIVVVMPMNMPVKEARYVWPREVTAEAVPA